MWENLLCVTFVSPCCSLPPLRASRPRRRLWKCRSSRASTSAKQRVALRKLSACLAQARPGWARQTLAQPYLSDAQATFAGQALSGQDKCIKGQDVEVTFRTSGLVGSLAEHFLQPDIGRADLPLVGNRWSSLTPLNASEDFAFCVTAADPIAARDMILKRPGERCRNPDGEANRTPCPGMRRQGGPASRRPAGAQGAGLRGALPPEDDRVRRPDRAVAQSRRLLRAHFGTLFAPSRLE